MESEESKSASTRKHFSIPIVKVAELTGGNKERGNDNSEGMKTDDMTY